jgi:hypothetical protein
MTLKKIIKVEEKKVFKKPNNLCKVNGSNIWYMITDINTQSTGIIPEHELNKNYEKMIGFSSDGKQMYMERE